MSTVNDTPITEQVPIDTILATAKEVIAESKGEKRYLPKPDYKIGRLNAGNIRISENYEAIVSEKRQIQELKKMENFASKITKLQKAIDEKDKELKKHSDICRAMEVDVNVIEKRVDTAAKLLRQLIDINVSLKRLEKSESRDELAMSGIKFNFTNDDRDDD